MSRSRLGAVATVASAALIALLIGWPALDGGALGHRTLDGLGSWWFQWFVGTSIADGTSPLQGTPLFHPYGKDILQHTGANLVDAVASVPLRHLFGPTAGWNALAIGVLLSNGAAAAWALRRQGWSAALTAGAVVALNPYSLYELAEGRPTQALLAPLILAVMWASDETARPTRHGWIRVGVAVAVAGYVYWFGALFAGLAVAALALARPRTLPAMAMAGGLSAILALPIIAPLFLQLGAGEVPGTLPVGGWWTALDLTTAEGDVMVLCTLGSACDVGKQAAGAWTPVGPATGLAFWIAAAVASLRDWRLGLVLAVAALLAVGPRPADVANPFYLALTALPGMDRLYWPCRALALLVPLAAIGVSELARRHPIAGPAVLLAMVTESAARDRLPLDTWDPDPPAALACIGDGGVIDLPHDRDHEPLLLQTWHHQPILGGMNPRSRGQVPQPIQALRSDDVWLAALLEAVFNPRAEVPGEAVPSEALHALGYRWVVLRVASIRSLVPTPDLHLRALEARLDQLAGTALVQDDALWIHAPWGDRCR